MADRVWNSDYKDKTPFSLWVLLQDMLDFMSLQGWTSSHIQSPPIAIIAFLYLSAGLLVEENQCSSMSMAGLMTSPSATGLSLNMEMPRKRKGSTDNQWALWLLVTWVNDVERCCSQ